jgi:hypothetical protein
MNRNALFSLGLVDLSISRVVGLLATEAWLLRPLPVLPTITTIQKLLKKPIPCC